MGLQNVIVHGFRQITVFAVSVAHCTSEIMLDVSCLIVEALLVIKYCIDSMVS